jgi:ABC-type multidrug transport system ATPase subunit
MQETLTYAALLRLPGSMTRKQKVERVDTVLQALGLTKSRDTIIGR